MLGVQRYEVLGHGYKYKAGRSSMAATICYERHQHTVAPADSRRAIEPDRMIEREPRARLERGGMGWLRWSVRWIRLGTRDRVLILLDSSGHDQHENTMSDRRLHKSRANDTTYAPVASTSPRGGRAYTRTPYIQPSTSPAPVPSSSTPLVGRAPSGSRPRYSHVRSQSSVDYPRTETTQAVATGAIGGAFGPYSVSIRSMLLGRCSHVLHSTNTVLLQSLLHFPHLARHKGTADRVQSRALHTPLHSLTSRMRSGRNQCRRVNTRLVECPRRLRVRHPPLPARFSTTQKILN